MTKDLLSEARLVAIDVETSGSLPGRDRITEIGIVEIEALSVVDSWGTFLRPPSLGWSSGGLEETGAGGPNREEEPALPIFDEIAAGLAARFSLADGLICHNAPFDMRFMLLGFERVGIAPIKKPVIDTLCAAREAWGRGENSLGEVAARMGVKGEHTHRALPDALLTARILIEFAAHLGSRFRLDEFPGYTPDASTFLRERPAIPFRKPDAAGPAVASPPGQHRAVVETLLRSAIRSAREISAVVASSGGARRQDRFVPLHLDGVRLVIRRASAPSDEVLRIEDVKEVAW